MQNAKDRLFFRKSCFARHVRNIAGAFWCFLVLPEVWGEISSCICAGQCSTLLDETDEKTTLKDSIRD